MDKLDKNVDLFYFTKNLWTEKSVEMEEERAIIGKNINRIGFVIQKSAFIACHFLSIQTCVPCGNFISPNLLFFNSINKYSCS